MDDRYDTRGGIICLYPCYCRHCQQIVPGFCQNPPLNHRGTYSTYVTCPSCHKAEKDGPEALEARELCRGDWFGATEWIDRHPWPKKSFWKEYD